MKQEQIPAKTVEQLAGEIAVRIVPPEFAEDVGNLLIEFANEILRKAIEP